MAADIGTGSIVGVATALRIGGPGSLFWMWISAILGMVTKYSESLLAVKYRVTDENNQMAGGPMFYIQNGMGERFIWLAKIFSVFGKCTGKNGLKSIRYCRPVDHQRHYRASTCSKGHF